VIQQLAFVVGRNIGITYTCKELSNCHSKGHFSFIPRPLCRFQDRANCMRRLCAKRYENISPISCT